MGNCLYAPRLNTFSQHCMIFYDLGDAAGTSWTFPVYTPACPWAPPGASRTAPHQRLHLFWTFYKLVSYCLAHYSGNIKCLQRCYFSNSRIVFRPVFPTTAAATFSFTHKHAHFFRPLLNCWVSQLAYLHAISSIVAKLCFCFAHLLH